MSDKSQVCIDIIHSKQEIGQEANIFKVFH